MSFLDTQKALLMQDSTKTLKPAQFKYCDRFQSHKVNKIDCLQMGILYLLTQKGIQQNFI